jgi:hypothetical protein
MVLLCVAIGLTNLGHVQPWPTPKDSPSCALRPSAYLFTIINMRTSRAAGLVLLAAATMAQQQQTVEITSEPSHHKVFENEYVRVFNVTVAPKASTLVHLHNYDYLFVTLGDSDVVSVRPGEKPVALQLKDGEVRFTPGHFAHAAINNAATPFHNITIELLKPSTNVKTCTESCETHAGCVDRTGIFCVSTRKLISSDQWTASLVTMPPRSFTDHLSKALPRLVVPVSKLSLLLPGISSDISRPHQPGQLVWRSAGDTFVPSNIDAANSAHFVVLEFHPEAPKP